MSRRRRGARAIGYAARRGGALARRAGKAQLPAVGIALGGLIVGFADARGLFTSLPAIGGSRALTLGLAGYAVTRFIKNPTIRMAGVAAIAAAAFDFGKVHGAPPLPRAPGGGGEAAALPGAARPARGAAGIDEAVGAHDDASGYQGDGGPY
jgi:hypothetical protein